MDVNYHDLREWVWHMPEQAIRTRERILSGKPLFDDTGRDAWSSIKSLYVLLVVSGDRELADQLLQTFMQASADEQSSSSPLSKDIAVACSYSGLRPANLPQDSPEDPSEQSVIHSIVEGAKKPDFDIGNPAFFQLQKWTDKTILETCPDPNAPPKHQKPHSWRESDDAVTHGNCARLLCQVPEGEVPRREAVEEAFEALKALFTKVPKRMSAENPRVAIPHSQIFPLSIYFLIALNLGKREEALEAIDLAFSKIEWSADDFLDLPVFWALILDRTTKPKNTGVPLGPEEARSALNTITEALLTRKENGKPIDDFAGLSWRDLLRRFSEAEFHRRRREHSRGEEGYNDELLESPSDVLLPPLTPADIAEAEAKLGPIPQDIKDMSLVARGFKGGWHFAGGGFPGIQDVWEEDMEEHVIYLDIHGDQADVEIRTEQLPDGTMCTVREHCVYIDGSQRRQKKAVPDMCWVCDGTVENDDFLHVICPPRVWKGINPGEVKKGEYRVFNYAHWTDGPQDGEFDCMRDWIVWLTKSLEE